MRGVVQVPGMQSADHYVTDVMMTITRKRATSARPISSNKKIKKIDGHLLHWPPHPFADKVYGERSGRVHLSYFRGLLVVGFLKFRRYREHVLCGFNSIASNLVTENSREPAYKTMRDDKGVYVVK